MKIAVITDDFKTISAHFGRARNYLVFTVEDGKIAGQEKRAKAHHGQFAVGPEEHHHHGGEHGHDPAAGSRHGLMAEPLADCQVLLARGMGNGAYNALRARHHPPPDRHRRHPGRGAGLPGRDAGGPSGTAALGRKAIAGRWNARSSMCRRNSARRWATPTACGSCTPCGRGRAA